MDEVIAQLVREANTGNTKVIHALARAPARSDAHEIRMTPLTSGPVCGRQGFSD